MTLGADDANPGLAVYTLTSELSCAFAGLSSSQGTGSLPIQCAWTFVVVSLRSMGLPALFFMVLLSLYINTTEFS